MPALGKPCLAKHGLNGEKETLAYMMAYLPTVGVASGSRESIMRMEEEFGKDGAQVNGHLIHAQRGLV